MKNIRAFSIILFLIFIFCSCGSGQKKNNEQQKKDSLARRSLAVSDSIANQDSILSRDTIKSPDIPHWKFSPEVNQILNVVLPNDTEPDFRFVPPDSSNTRVFDISTDTNSVYLIETNAGVGGWTGSCGAMILVVRKRKNIVETLFNDCGSVDTVLDIAHNGMHDFKIRYREFYSKVPLFYRYDGKRIIQYADPQPEDFYTMIRETIKEFKSGDYLGDDSLQFTYADFGSSDIFMVKHSVMGIYLIKENSSRSFEVVNYFSEGCDVDILENKTMGMHDIRITEISYKIAFYQWNGKQYALKTSRSLF
jgi:hypothetical protein